MHLLTRGKTEERGKIMDGSLYNEIMDMITEAKVEMQEEIDRTRVELERQIDDILAKVDEKE